MSVPSTLRRHWPLVLPLSFLWTSTAVILATSLQQNQGHLIYDLDDPYIHMSIAKNLLQHGLWGVTGYEFSSSASSILWPALIAAGYAVFGVNEASPLVIDVLLATALVAVVYRLLVTQVTLFPRLVACLASLLIILVTPLPALVFSGLEHVLHTLLTLVFVCVAARSLCREPHQPTTREPTLLLVLAPLLTLTRYEGLFAVLVVCLLLALRQRWRYAVQLGALAVLPVALYGLYSVGQGWLMLPNPVLLKGNLQTLTSLHERIAALPITFNRDLLQTPHLQLLVVLGLSLYALRFQGRHRGWEPGQIMLVLFVGVSLLHLLIAGRVRWFYRHDAYLVALGVFVVAATAPDAFQTRWLGSLLRRSRLPQYAALAALAALLALPVAKRGAASLLQRAGSIGQVAQATTNIYEQQYQMGLFLRQYYAGEAIAANDIGAISYLADVRIVDLVGLATLEIARLRLTGRLDRASLDAVVEDSGASVAIVYDSWFRDEHDDLIPARWRLVGQWTISNNVSAGGHTVSFYAVDPSEEPRLRSSLSSFAGRLPPQVKQAGTYLLTSSEGGDSRGDGDAVPQDLHRSPQ